MTDDNNILVFPTEKRAQLVFEGRTVNLGYTFLHNLRGWMAGIPFEAAYPRERDLFHQILDDICSKCTYPIPEGSND